MTDRRNFLRGSVGLGAVMATSALAAEEPAAGPSAAGRDLGKAKELPAGRYDEHIHVYQDTDPRPEAFAARLGEAGITGGCVYSREQGASARRENSTRLTPEQIVDNVIGWCSASPTLYPFFWIDPSRADAVELVDMAVEKGICGFKVIRNNGMPCDGAALDAYRRMAHYGRPVLFHSGILYDGIPSSEYFRPVAFEPLLKAPRLRFGLAHISWPWCDECLAVFGKVRDTPWRLALPTDREPNPDVPTMFIDTAPGPKQIWRSEALRKIYLTQFRRAIHERLMFGTDCNVHDYKVKHCRTYQDFDDALFREMELSEGEIDAYYRTALQSFLFGVKG